MGPSRTLHKFLRRPRSLDKGHAATAATKQIRKSVLFQASAPSERKPGRLSLAGGLQGVPTAGRRARAPWKKESITFGDARYQGVQKRPDANADVTWHIAMQPGKRRALDKANPADALLDQAEKLKAAVRAKVEHPLCVIKRQFGFVKVRYRGLKKNTAQPFTLFALSNLCMVHTKLTGAGV